MKTLLCCGPCLALTGCGYGSQLAAVAAGRKPPTGKESNWIPTDPTRGFELMVRLYGPTKAFFDKQWKLGDVEEMKSGAFQ